jgi:hypothetical protein
LLSEAQRSTNTAKFNHAMSKFFDIFGLLQRLLVNGASEIGCDLLSNSLISLVFYNTSADKARTNCGCDLLSNSLISLVFYNKSSVTHSDRML